MAFMARNVSYADARISTHHCANRTNTSTPCERTGGGFARTSLGRVDAYFVRAARKVYQYLLRAKRKRAAYLHCGMRVFAFDIIVPRSTGSKRTTSERVSRRSSRGRVHSRTRINLCLQSAENHHAFWPMAHFPLERLRTLWY